MKAVADRLAKLGFKDGVFCIQPPENCKDVNDWFTTHPDTFKGEWALALENAKAVGLEDPPKERRQERKEPPSNIQDRFFQTVLGLPIICFRDQLGDAYAAARGDGAEVLRIHSNRFKLWLRRQIYQLENTSAGAEVIENLASDLEAMALFGTVQHRLDVRVARRGNVFYYDLGARVVEITVDGWRILDNPPILFKRYGEDRSQVEPVRGGNIDQILEYVRFKTEDDKLITKVRFVDALIEGHPHPLEALSGDPGAGKTTYTKFFKSLIDPPATETRGTIGDIKEFIQFCAHNYVVVLDNQRWIPKDFSDLLCRLVIGEGFSKRVLHTDDDDFRYSIRNVISLNGVNLTATESDLLDRPGLNHLERIPARQVREEAEILRAFEEAKPRLLGSLFDVLSRAIGIYPTVKLQRRPRMADFNRWGEAISQAMGYEPGTFVQAYRRNRELQKAAVLDNSPVAQAIIVFMADKPVWSGSPNGLLTELETAADDANIKTNNKKWPKDGSWLWKRIAEVRPTLLACGIEAVRDRHHTTMITLTKHSQEGEPEEGDDDGDDGGGPGEADSGQIAQRQQSDSIRSSIRSTDKNAALSEPPKTQIQNRSIAVNLTSLGENEEKIINTIEGGHTPGVPPLKLPKMLRCRAAMLRRPLKMCGSSRLRTGLGPS